VNPLFRTPSRHRASSHRRALRRLWLPVALGLLIASTSAASAFWNSSGVGTGGGVTGTALPVVLTPGSPAAQLRPGGVADATLTMTNPNGFPVTIGSLILDTTHGTGGFAVDSGHAACNTSSLGFTTATAGWTVPAKVGSTDGTLDVVLSHSVSMASSAPDACQGVNVSVYLQAAS
jgi:hypothetical protein